MIIYDGNDKYEEAVGASKMKDGQTGFIAEGYHKGTPVLKIKTAGYNVLVSLSSGQSMGVSCIWPTTEFTRGPLVRLCDFTLREKNAL